ncbi:MAG: HAMP domain-containing histidine kinase [Candidatus Thiodiazotropha sp. (ex Dulcina madagascariensis)]|nr:HAMP domain-containing histidine kinase [Candidatus Thiodiazotropha sp. (ex Dulcina madagascariensis)]
MMLGDISYRVKVPFILTLVILITASVVTLALTWRAYEELREEAFHNAVEIGSVLSNSLPNAMLHDDLWGAYRLVQAAEGWPGEASSRLLVVLDRDGLIYVSNHPRELAVTTPLRSHGAELARVEVEALRLTGNLDPRSYEHKNDQRLYVILPMLTDGVAIGTLIVGYDRSLFWPRFISIVERVVMSALVVTVLLLPLGWFLGNRVVSPLGQLAKCMSMVGHEKPEEIVCNLRLGDDEIGQLGVSFQKMLLELEEKEQLENNMLTSERLAAVGRLAAGVAHEINNPLGGMLNALNTFRHYSETDDLGRETFSLIERGLQQIRDTVSALLVEANPRSHSLSPKDIDDVRTLLLPDVNRKGIELVWGNEITDNIPLPSTPIRQLLINLSLNAVQASNEKGMVQCLVDSKNGILSMRVENEGPEIPKARMMHLFEPFADGATGNGLGLWVSYQLVHLLDGKIKVRSENGKTRFKVELPIGERM